MCSLLRRMNNDPVKCQTSMNVVSSETPCGELPPNMLTALFDQVLVVFVFILFCYTLQLKTKQKEKRIAK